MVLYVHRKISNVMTISNIQLLNSEFYFDPFEFKYKELSLNNDIVMNQKVCKKHFVLKLFRKILCQTFLKMRAKLNAIE